MSEAAQQLVDQVHHLVDRARLLPVDESARVLEQVVTIGQAAQAEVLIDGERSGALADSGRSTVRSFATAILRRGVHDADAFAQTARHLVDLPHLAAAYRAGQVHTGNLRTILKHRKACGLDVLQAHEEQLVMLATQTGPKEINQFCQLLADLNHPDRDEAKIKALGLRSVRIARVGDLARLDAMLDPVVADQLKATLAAMAKAARTPDDTRTHGERTADALEQILAAGMNTTDLPTQARRRPHTVLHTQLATLLGMPGHGRAWLERFGLIPTSTATRIACDSLIRMVVQHGDRVLNVGPTKRLVTDRQHTALAALYSECVTPGCAVRFADCDIHHLWWHSLGGPTDLDLQIPLCKSDHTRVHDHQLTITREAGALVFRDPHGRMIVDPTAVLNEQLHLLHPQPENNSSTAETVLDQVDGWPHSPYQHNTWGWTGQNPNPPPGHDPPQTPAA